MLVFACSTRAESSLVCQIFHKKLIVFRYVGQPNNIVNIIHYRLIRAVQWKLLNFRKIQLRFFGSENKVKPYRYRLARLVTFLFSHFALLFMHNDMFFLHSARMHSTEPAGFGLFAEESVPRRIVGLEEPSKPQRSGVSRGVL